MKRNYQSRRDRRIIDPTFIGGPLRGLFAWRRGAFVAPFDTLELIAGRIDPIGQELILDVFQLQVGNLLPRDGIFYEDGLGIVDPIQILVINTSTIAITYARPLEVGVQWVTGTACKFRGSSGEVPSDAVIDFNPV